MKIQAWAIYNDKTKSLLFQPICTTRERAELEVAMSPARDKLRVVAVTIEVNEAQEKVLG